MNDIIIGIDLGTTNSEVAVVLDKEIKIIETDGRSMLPSVVGLDDDGKMIVGIQAYNQYILHPERTIKSIKRKMGENITVPLGDQTFTPQEISAAILRCLKEQAEAYLQQAVTKAVITVPAYFSDQQRQATRDAGEIAGLEVVRIVNEPTAACMAFEHESEKQKIVMAFDLGGGTFDVSIVRMEGDLVEVIGSHGDTKLGGDDVDQLLQDELYNLLHHQNDEKSFDLTHLASNRLNRAAQLAKVKLSSSDFTSIIEDNLTSKDNQTLHFETEFTREDLDSLIQPLLIKTLNSVHKALAEAKVSIADLDEILLVGGSTRIPAISKMLEEEFAIKPRTDIHPDLAVAYGAGVMAARLMGADNRRILVDITPYTFGTSALGFINGHSVPYKYCPIIMAGTPLPCSKSSTFYTAYDGQKSAKITVLQGENEDARENILLGDFLINNLDEEADEGNKLVFHMTLDLDGILHLQVTEKETGLSKEIEIEKSLGQLSSDALQAAKKRLAKWFSGELDDENTETDDVQYDTIHTLIKKAEMLKSKMDDVDTKETEDLIQQLETEISNKAPVESLQAHVDELEELLFYLDSAR
ncbi:MAG: Hsp70 family protein [Mariprofundaceae bacterium]|nr:Hsp70 family protein [Mariprofundaceae bacterium]